MSFVRAIAGALYLYHGKVRGKYTGSFEEEGFGDRRKVWFEIDEGNCAYGVEDVPEQVRATTFHVEITVPDPVIEATNQDAARKNLDTSFDDMLQTELKTLSERLEVICCLTHTEDKKLTIRDAETPERAWIDYDAGQPRIGTKEGAPLMVPMTEVIADMPEATKHVDQMAMWLDVEEFLCDRCAGAPKIGDEMIYLETVPDKGVAIGLVEASDEAMFDSSREITVSWMETFFNALGGYTGRVILLNE